MNPYPKIELHVHIEGTVRAPTLLAIARRNGFPLPGSTVEELRSLYTFRDFSDFVRVWTLTTAAMRHVEDFRQIAVDYAREAAAAGAVYIEATFSPTERIRDGIRWDDLFEGYCEAVAEAREAVGVELRFAPEFPRGFSVEDAETTVRWAAAYRDRGVVGVGVAGLEEGNSVAPYAPVFARARGEGLAVLPHAGEHAGAWSVRECFELLAPRRIRHGIRAVEDASLLAELAAAELVLDVCPTSNVGTGATPSLAVHPLPRLVQAGVACSISTDDPAFFDTDLGREHDIAREFGLDPRTLYDVGVRAAACDEATRGRLVEVGVAYDWGRPLPAGRVGLY